MSAGHFLWEVEVFGGLFVVAFFSNTSWYLKFRYSCLREHVSESARRFVWLMMFPVVVGVYLIIHQF